MKTSAVHSAMIFPIITLVSGISGAWGQDGVEPPKGTPRPAVTPMPSMGPSRSIFEVDVVEMPNVGDRRAEITRLAENGMRGFAVVGTVALGDRIMIIQQKTTSVLPSNDIDAQVERLRFPSQVQAEDVVRLRAIAKLAMEEVYRLFVSRVSPPNSHRDGGMAK